MTTCEMCGGALGLLGTLGNLDHFQCRDCGWTTACDASPDESEQVEDDAE